MACCSTLEMRIQPDRIHFLKFILEGYDGMALQSTLDPRLGIIKISYPPELSHDIEQLLLALMPSVTSSEETKASC
jgi:hypothetical protein